MNNKLQYPIELNRVSYFTKIFIGDSCSWGYIKWALK